METSEVEPASVSETGSLGLGLVREALVSAKNITAAGYNNQVQGAATNLLGREAFGHQSLVPPLGLALEIVEPG